MIDDEELAKICSALSSNDASQLSVAITCLKEQLHKHKDSLEYCIRDLYSNCPKNLNKQLMLLCADILSNYPKTIYAAPILIEITPFSSKKNPESQQFLLPAPNPASRYTSQTRALEFVGWASIDSDYSVPSLYKSMDVQVGVSTSALALFRLHEAKEIEVIPAEFWEELFNLEHTANIAFATEHIYLYPVALEVCRAMLPNTIYNNSFSKSSTYFLSSEDEAWAEKAYILFNEYLKSRKEEQDLIDSAKYDDLPQDDEDV